MCPNRLFLYLFFLALSAVMFYIYRRLLACIRENLDTVSRLLQAPQREPSFLRAILSGYYKGRKVRIVFPYTDEGSPMVFSIEPRQIPHPQKTFLLSHPRPTSNTQWRGTKVYFSRAGISFRKAQSYYKIYREDELKEIIDELSEAAEKVESGACRPG